MDRSGRTLLARACASGVADEAEKWLKERPEDINVADYAGNTPLQVACLEGNEDIVKLLLDGGCRTDSKNVDHDTPLIDAVENGHLEVVRLLLDAGADPSQRNARGKEPIELVNPDMDDPEEIRLALTTSKKDKDGKRRKSEDHSRQKMSVPRELEASSITKAGPSPTHGTRSPPLEPGARRRTARSQHTDASLLYVNATPQRLRDAAGKGEMNIVSHILNMRPEADTEAILAAAQGGHDEVLGLMLAIAQPESDPSPLRTGKAGHATPMLTAIGRGNLKVLDLLVQQPGFDPTRRLYKNLTYFELAKERQGTEWQEEYDLLKDAYDHYRKNGGRRSNNASPNKVRPKRKEKEKGKEKESRKSSPEPSSSPHEVRKVRRPQPVVKDEQDGEPRRRPSYQGTALKQRDRDESRKTPSSVASDHEPEVRRGKENKLINRVRSTSPGQAAVQKPRRRLLSGNDVKTDQDSRRKANLAAGDKERRKSGDSATSHEAPHRRSSDASMSAPPMKKASSESPRRTKEESNSSKKRLRTSISPHASRSDANDMMAKKKRLRVDSNGNAIDQGRERSHRPGPAPPAHMVPSPPVASSPKMSHAAVPTAPVAFMGSATTSPATKSPVKTSSVEPSSKSAQISPVSNIDPALPQSPNQQEDESKAAAREENARKNQEEAERQRKEQLEQDEKARIVAEEIHKVKAEKQAQLQKEREEAEREAKIAREKEEAAERQASEERRKEREEIEAQAKKRKEEENQKRRLEQERQRKADLEKRRREAEQVQLEMRLKAQQEEERLRRNALPNGLRRYFELSPEEARSTREIKKWLPLRTVTTEDLEPGSNVYGAVERWIANIQAAPLLANKDLELSQCKFHAKAFCCLPQLSNTRSTDTAWSRRPATSSQQAALWRQLRNPMAQSTGSTYISSVEAHRLEMETMPKFLNLHVFWIKLSDFMDIVPRHPHLVPTNLIHQDFVLQQYKFGLQPRPRGGGGEELTGLGIKQEGRSPTPTANGNGATINGHR